MGCINTKEDEVRDSQSSSLLVALPKTSKSPLSDQEIESRIECPTESQTMKLGKIVYRYAYVSQRGYYPDSPAKDNQDCYTVMPTLEHLDGAFFGVYDGHGKEGHLCSRYIRDKLPNAITTAVCNLSKPTVENVKKSLHNTHIRVNRNLHESRVDDSLSGTTSISMLILGRTMYISNVGDSRAIIISMEDGKLKARPLSSDQTPYRKDERERVKKYGARVMSMDQIEGVEPIHENWGDINLGEEIDEGGDPPRIWSPHGAYPGTAFTRSFGDMYAEELGVTAEPEILVRDIQPNDRFIVLASDGVFEFLTNQMVADMIAQRPDPLDACRAIVAQSYELWLQYEVRTDDITIIAIYIQSGQDLIEQTAVSTTDIQLIEENTNRPVRRAVSREKRKILIQAAEDSRSLSQADNTHQILASKTPKTPEETAAILLAINDNFLFHHLSESQRHNLVESMQKVNVQKGDWIIKQGDVGDRFYIIESGKYEVRVRTPQTEPQDSPGNVVHVYESGPNQHPCFGELALMYGKPRAASVIAQTDGSLWALDRFIFVNSVLRTQTVRKDILRVLRKVELLKSLNTIQLQRLVDQMREVQFQMGETVIKQGDPGESFYVIVSGTCSVLIQNANGEENEVARLGSNSYFGERALLTSEPRAATIKAATNISLLEIGRRGFEEVLGQLSVIIAVNQQQKIQKTRIISEKEQPIIQIPEKLTDIHLNGSVSTDKFGSICLGTFHSPKPNVSIKSFLLDAKDARVLLQDLSNSKEATHVIESSITPDSLHFIPLLITSFRTSNGFHMLYDTSVVASLESLYQSDGSHIQLLPYVAANIINGLEFLHKIGIVYRSIQPEAIHITSQGKIVLMDYSICKIGGVGRESFTFCGVPDYLSPEQVSQLGHNEAVDFWSLGVLLYELTTHTNPFSQESSGELAIFSKITSYGTPSFPQLTFPSIFPSDLSSLIQQLVVSSPTERLGVGANGFSNLRRHQYFSSIKSFNPQTLVTNSPIQNLAKEMEEFIISESVTADMMALWNKEVAGTEYIDDLLKD